MVKGEGLATYKSAYRKMMMKCHPDLNKDATEAEKEEMLHQAILANAAWEIIEKKFKNG